MMLVKYWMGQIIRPAHQRIWQGLSPQLCVNLAKVSFYGKELPEGSDNICITGLVK